MIPHEGQRAPSKDVCPATVVRSLRAKVNVLLERRQCGKHIFRVLRHLTLDVREDLTGSRSRRTLGVQEISKPVST